MPHLIEIPLSMKVETPQAKQSNQADCNEIQRHDKIQQAWHQQYQDAGDQCQ
jgi:hypothetical protein